MNPNLSEEEKRALKMKNEMNRKRVKFRRQEWFRYKRLGESWRRPKGKHSKMRERKKYRIPVVDSGYRTPKIVRGLHPSGFREVLIHNVKELERIDPRKEAARISARVGVKKRTEIEKRAEELKIRILNPMKKGD